MKDMHTDQPASRFRARRTCDGYSPFVDVTGIDQQFHSYSRVVPCVYITEVRTYITMSTRSKRTSDVMKAGMEVQSDDGSELEELNEEEYERERLENIKYVKSLRSPLASSLLSCHFDASGTRERRN